MRGAWLQDGELVYRDDLPEPEPKSGEVRIAVAYAGVCATDLALASGYMNFTGIPGHEFVGRALEGELEGQLVVGEINAGCGDCADCLGPNAGRHCASRDVLGILKRPGAFAEMLRLPSRNLLPLQEDSAGNPLDPRHAVFAEPLAAAFQILEQVPDLAGSRCLVAGDGRLGLLIAKVLHHAGAKVDLAGHHPERVPAGIGDRCFLLDGTRTRSRDEAPYDLAVEATGKDHVLQSLFSWVRPRGTVVLKTTTGRSTSLDLTPVVVDELNLIGSRCGRFEPALRALQSGAIEVESMIHDTYSLHDAPEALRRAAQPGVLKILIYCLDHEPSN
ncbi:MAG: threonine dehydrogenase-like Zn-dependent dehydrogenase [Gammaproteobacteria bacterium]|jgi:threonine dehydrogenase-like Zn-dependent dehydrogenase